MIHLSDRAGFARALTLDLDPKLHDLLAKRIGALSLDLIDYTEYLIVQADDTEEDIISAIGLSPLIEPFERARYGGTGFQPGWDWLAAHDGWFELIYTFGSTFACILLIQDVDGVPTDLLALCRQYSGT